MVLTIFAPPIALILIEKARMTPKNKHVKFCLDISLLAGEIYFAVPLGLALYDRQGTIPASELEEEFQDIRNKKTKEQMIKKIR